MKTYKGTKSNGGMGGQKIMVDEGGVLGQYEVYPLKHIVQHSPDGFNWRYGGSGPADTALSILTDCVGKRIAEVYYQGFKERFVSIWGECFEVTENEIKTWIQVREDQMKSVERT